jgi:hypothetical protein
MKSRMSQLVSALRRPSTRPTRFVVLSQLCTASSLFCESLRRHPQILMHGEILNQNYRRYELPSNSGSERFRAAFSLATHDVIGCKLHACHPNPGFEHWESAWDELFADPTIKIIQLTRQNTLAQLAAWKIAGVLGGPTEQASAVERPVIRIDPGEFAWFQRWNTMAYQVRLARLQRHAILPITFESLYDHWQATVERVLRFIDVEPIPLDPCEPWRETRPLEQIVANHAELVGNH